MAWFQKRTKWIDRPRHLPPSPKIAFFKAYPWHSTILLPIAAKLFDKVDLCSASTGRELIAQKPDIIVVADAGVIPFLREKMPKAIYVHVCHGLISKNQPYYSFAHADYICVTSDFIAERFEQSNCRPRKQFWATGLPFMDILSGATSCRPLTAAHPLTLLYAPTWNPTLSSAEIFSDRLVKYLRGPHEEWSIYIKPHPHSFQASPDWIHRWSQLAHKHPHVHLVNENEDLASMALQADMMISDTSSAAFSFLALNRPLLLLRNPQAESDHASYDPEGLEWQWRDMAYEVTQPEKIYSQITEILSRGDEKRNLRETYREKLFENNLDGGCAQRIANKILELTQNGS